MEAKRTVTNCVNCGAPLDGHICAYCGTKYTTPQDEVERLKAELNMQRLAIAHTEQTARLIEGIQPIARDINGRIVRGWQW